MSSSEADVFFELMEKDCRIGRRGWNEGVIGKMLELDDDETQDMMRRLRSRIQVSVADLEPAVEGLNRLLLERKQAMKTQQQEAAREAEDKRRRQGETARRVGQAEMAKEVEQQRRRQEELVRKREQQKKDEAKTEME